MSISPSSVRTKRFKRWFGDWDQLQIEKEKAKGVDAINKVLDTKKSVQNAMFRPEVGGITFDYGYEGKASNNYKSGGYGISHIVARRGIAEGLKVDDFLQEMVDTIATGDVTPVYGTQNQGQPRVNIEKNGLIVTLSLERFGNKETWLVSGAYRVGAGVASGNVNPSGTTQKGTPFTYSDLGAALKVRLPAYQPKVNENDVSKVIDENGEPLVVYRGDVRESEEGRFFTSSPDIAAGYAMPTFFRGGKEPHITSGFLSLKSPLIIDAQGKRNDNIPVPWKEWKPKVFGNLPNTATSVDDAYNYAIKHGHDGVIVKNVIDTADPTEKAKPSDVFATESPNQIKSAIGNQGTYSDAHGEILEMAAGEEPEMTERDAYSDFLEDGDLMRTVRLNLKPLRI